MLVDPEELKALRLASTHVIELERVVDAATIDSIYGHEPYYLAPSAKTGSEAFGVIVAAMRAKGRIGIGRLVLSMRERICALEPRADCILLTTLRTHEDVLPACEAGDIEPLPKTDRSMLEIAEKIVDQLEGKFDPATFKDRYEDAVRDLIARKKKGQKVTAASPLEHRDGKVINLMEALRRSLAGQDAGSQASARRFFARKKGKADGKAKPRKKSRVGQGPGVLKRLAPKALIVFDTSCRRHPAASDPTAARAAICAARRLPTSSTLVFTLTAISA